MDLADMIGNDFQIFDGEQALILVQAGVGSVTVNGCTTSKITKAQIEMLGGSLGLQSVYRNFSLPVANLNGAVPRQGDTLTDPAEDVWRIHSVELRTLNTRHFCLCIQQ